MARIENLESLQAKLKQEAKKYADASVSVGYTAAYALFVHENLQASWRGLPRDPRLRETKSGKHQTNPKPRLVNPKGFFWDPLSRAQPKFLEAPARYLSKELGEIVARAMMAKKTMTQALILAALRLGRESQQLVPVDTGNLKSSLFYAVNDGEKIPLETISSTS